MIEKSGRYLLDNRWQALLIVLVLSTFPLLSSFALCILALLSLRKSWQESFAVLIVSLIPGFIIYSVGKIDSLSWMIASAIPVLLWLLAIELRRSISWAWILQGSAVLGILFVGMVHLINPEVGAWWESALQVYLNQATQLGLTVPGGHIEEFIHRSAEIATGSQAAMVLLMSLSFLVVGRYWQASLFNPRQLKPELQGIRLSVYFTLIVLLLVILAIVLRSETLLDLMPLLVLIEVLAGLSLVHYFVEVRKIGWAWLVLFYIGAGLLIAFSVALLALLAMFDSFFNLRSKMIQK